jgi:hypothetical protein
MAEEIEVHGFSCLIWKWNLVHINLSIGTKNLRWPVIHIYNILKSMHTKSIYIFTNQK